MALTLFSGYVSEHNSHFDIAEGRWYHTSENCPQKYVPAVPALCTNPAVLIHKNRVFVIGGAKDMHSSACKDEVYMFDLADKKWYSGPKLARPRSLHSAVSIGSMIYVVGGHHDMDNILCGERYDSEHPSDGWQKFKDMAETRCYVAAFNVKFGEEECVMVVGGTDDFMSARKSCERYSPSTETWSPCADMLVPRMRSISMALNNKVFMWGGESEWMDKILTAECYSPDANQWTKLNDLPKPTAFKSAFDFGGTIYTVFPVSVEVEADEGFWVGKYSIKDDKWEVIESTKTAHGADCALALTPLLQ